MKFLQLLVLLLFFSFFSCENSTKDQPDDDNSIPVEEDVFSGGDTDDNDNYTPEILCEEAVFESGSGTENDPFKISTPNHLQNIRYCLESHFIQTKDIDLKDFLSEDGEGFNDGKGWVPIGTFNEPFTGNYNGNSHIIDNLLIDRPESDTIGLFSTIGYLGSISNLKIKNSSIIGGKATGSLAGIVGFNAGISNVTIDGSVNGNDDTGCFSGRIGDKTSNTIGIEQGKEKVITNCHCNCTVNGKDNVGGFSGKINNSIASPVTKSSFSGTVTGENFVGGFCGYLYGDISLSSSSSQTEGLESIGGFAGFFESGEIKNSYSIGTVKGNGLISGFVGELGDSGSIENSYASATVITDKTNMGKGGLVGGEQTTCTIYNNEGGLDSWPMVIKSFFNSDLFQYSLEYYDECGKPLSTEEMKKESTFTDAQWDFENIWDITEDETFPFFR